MNTFGRLFRFTTWGESHGPAIGVVVDGCPAGLALTPEMVQQALDRRAPGRSTMTSPRREPDQVVIESGVWQGITTGAPIAMRICNQDAKPSAYQAITDYHRPGHANFTYRHKYGHMDQRGGGRASARETACRVMAGAVASAWLQQQGIVVQAALLQMGAIRAQHLEIWDMDYVYGNNVYTVEPEAMAAMVSYIEALKLAGDSTGGVVGFRIQGCPIGLGEPIYGKCEALLAAAMLSIPASKGFEIGMGFQAATMKGSAHNDLYQAKAGQTVLASNRAGGILGGITQGETIWGQVAFKPTSSIGKPQDTTTFSGQPTTLVMGKKARHDPCVAIRAVPVVAAMAACVIADLALQAKTQMPHAEVSEAHIAT